MKAKKRYAGWSVLAGVILVVLLCLVRHAFTYLDRLVYTERQSQLKEVVSPYFEKIDTVTEQLWQMAEALENRVILQKPADVEDLQTLFEQEMAIQDWEEQGILPIAVRDDGKYVDMEGAHGSLGYTEPLRDCGKQTSFIYEMPYTGELLNLYVYRLEEPVQIQDKDTVYSIAFVGITRKMETMNQYFKCSSYGNDNSTYVLDRYGAKQYVDSSASMNLIEGHNVYGVLRKEYEAQGRDFDEVLTELDNKGIAYSDVKISGEQCFYAMRKMPNTDFVILYINPADRVATGTAALVNLVVMVFAVSAISIIVLIIVVASMVFARNRRQLVFETKSRRELQKLNNELDKTNMELQKASKAKSDFLANMSHDIRTPMNAIVGITGLMAREPNLSEKLYTYISKVQMSSQHLLSLINDVLDMSKIESGEVSLNSEPVSFAELIGQVDSIVRSQTNERGQDFQIRVHEVTHEYVISDGVRLRQLLINLLSNATKYTPAGGTITFDLGELACDKPGYASYCISVADTGYGMEKEFLEHIFEPFTRAESSVTNKVQGTGLGMAIAKNIVDLMGGTIQVDSALNEGTRFIVNLTLKIDHNSERIQGSDAYIQENKNVLRGLHFLCAEDNELNAEILEAMLNVEGATCTICHNGQEIVDTFKKVQPGEYDAILMDIQMPVMNGLEATRAIRSGANPLGRTIPILAMTANAFSEDIQNSIAAGMNAHISKPIDIKVLEREMSRLISISR